MSDVADTLHRFTAELRAADLSGNTVHGLAAVYDQAAEVNSRGDLEMIRAGALDNAVKPGHGQDIGAFLEHDTAKLLGRQSSGTLRTWTSAKGLHFELDLPDTQHGRDARELLRRKDLTGASFGFIPDSKGQEYRRSKQGASVLVHSNVLDVFDVSLVAFPAYQGAKVELRWADLRPVDSNRSRLIRARHNARKVGSL